MAAISRREFMERATVCSGVAGFLIANPAELRASPLGLPIGCQVYPVRTMLKDFPAFAKTMAEIGVTRLELCSPIGYGRDFAALASGSETRKILADHGMKAESSHFSMAELRNSHEKSIEWAKEVGITQMITASLGEGNGGNSPTLDQVKKAADEYNKIAAVAAKAGMQQGLHNEGFEVSMVDGKLTYDLLFQLLDPELVKFQFQMSTITAGLVGAEYFLKYPGRFHFDAFAGHRHERPGSGSAQGCAGGATQRPSPTGCLGRRHDRLGEDFHRREDRRGQELLRRAKLGAHEAECRVFKNTQCLIELRLNSNRSSGRGSRFEPLGQGREVGCHGAGRESLASRVAEHSVPVLGRAHGQDAAEKIADSFVAVIIALARVLFENLARDVVVKLKLDRRGDGIVVVLRGVVVDVRLGGGVAERLRSLARRRDPLVLPDQRPPGRIERTIGDPTRVKVVLEPRHHARRPWEEHHRRPVQGRVEQKRDRIGLLGPGAEQPDLLEIGPLPGRQADQVTDRFVERAVRTGAGNRARLVSSN